MLSTLLCSRNPCCLLDSRHILWHPGHLHRLLRLVPTGCHLPLSLICPHPLHDTVYLRLLILKYHLSLSICLATRQFSSVVRVTSVFVSRKLQSTREALPLRCLRPDSRPQIFQPNATPFLDRQLMHLACTQRSSTLPSAMSCESS